MASYPTTIVRQTKYFGTFPELQSPYEVLLNGVAAPAIVSPLTGGGYSVTIEAADVELANGQTTGTIVVKDGSHTFTTTITKT